MRTDECPSRWIVSQNEVGTMCSGRGNRLKSAIKTAEERAKGGWVGGWMGEKLVEDERSGVSGP